MKLITIPTAVSIAFLLGVVLTLLSPKCEAETSVYIDSWSTHYVKYDGPSYKSAYNDHHKILAIKHNNLSVGTFINSYDDRGYFIGYSRPISDNFYIGMLIVTGYKVSVLPVPTLGYTVPTSFEINGIKPQLEFNLIPGAITYSIKLTIE